MKTSILPVLLLFVVLCAAQYAFGEYSFEFSDDFRLTLGGDVRARYEGFTRDVIWVDGTGEDGPAVEYLRVRTRVWARLEMPDGICLNVRFVNRWHKVNSHFSDPNDNGTATWEFPDEVILDLLNIHFEDLPASGLSLTLGRQELGFGNGMLLAEGTPYDQGRTVYHDGAVLRYKTDTDFITLFSFYNEWKDRLAFINDRNRRLRSGDIFTPGAYWTHEFDARLNVDVYYMYNDVHDDYPDSSEASERNHPSDANLSLHTVGGRVFGCFNDNFDYSLEIARQGGRNNEGSSNQGMMFDARLRYHLPPETMFTPSLGFEFLALTGDKSDTSKSEGWHSLMTECPLWREELLPIMNNGVWTNLNMYRGDVVFKLTDKLQLTGALAVLMADETDFSTGGGNYLGLLFSAFVDYKLFDNLALSAEAAHFKPGDYYINGQDSVWGRLQATLTF